MPVGQRWLADQVFEAMQVLSRVVCQSHQALLQLQSEARGHL